MFCPRQAVGLDYGADRKIRDDHMLTAAEGWERVAIYRKAFTLTLCSCRLGISQVSDVVLNIATVDAHGMFL